MRKLGYIVLLILTSPFFIIGGITAIVECLLGSSGEGGDLIATPFIATLDHYLRGRK
jgi:hypothetical protein